MNKSMLDWALYYGKDKSWPIFPCRVDKTPYVKHGVLEATTNPKKITSWWTEWPNANIGLDVGSAGMMVLDLDPGYDMKELEKNVGSIPKTSLRANTPRGGKHLYFTIKDEEIIAASASKLARSVDVRSFHSYVLVPPSKTKDGSYAWEVYEQPSYRSDEMVRIANIAKERSQDHDTWIIDADLPENVQLARQWLQGEAKIGIVGQGGDATTYATAAHMKSFAISEAMAVELLWEHWCPRCDPPWEADKLEHLEQKVENAYKYNTSQPGNITPAYHAAKTKALFSPITEILDGTGEETKAGRFRFVNYSGLSQIRPPKWLIKNFLPENAYAMLFGAPETFKTFIALDIALTIAVGACMSANMLWPGIQAQGSVLFAAGEGRSSISNRVKAWSKTHFAGNEIPGFILGDPVPMVSENLEPFIEGALKASPTGDYKLIILDTVGRAMQGLNENSQEHASAFTFMLEQIQKWTGATVLCLHHVGYTDATRGRGSSVFPADADTVVRLDRKGSEHTVALTMTKQKDAEKWARPVYAKLLEVPLGLEAKSLVTMAMPKVETPTVKEEKQLQDKTIICDKIEEAILDHLQGIPGKELSDTALGTAISGYPYNLGLQGQRLARYWIPLIRSSERMVARHYLKDKNRWKWQQD